MRELRDPMNNLITMVAYNVMDYFKSSLRNDVQQGSILFNQEMDDAISKKAAGSIKAFQMKQFILSDLCLEKKAKSLPVPKVCIHGGKKRVNCMRKMKLKSNKVM